MKHRRLLHAAAHVLAPCGSRDVIQAGLEGAARGAILKRLGAVRQVGDGACNPRNDRWALFSRQCRHRQPAAALRRNELGSRQWRQQHRTRRAPRREPMPVPRPADERLHCMAHIVTRSAWGCDMAGRRARFRRHDRIGVAIVTLRGCRAGRKTEQNRGQRKTASIAHSRQSGATTMPYTTGSAHRANVGMQVLPVKDGSCAGRTLPT